jgi:hypothetical protein
MRSFSNYLQSKNADALMSEIAHKMVELNVDPWNFLMEYYKNEPEIVIALESHREESLNEFLGGLRRLGSAAMQGLGRLGQAAGAAGQAIAGGAVDAAKQARAAVAGPEAHYAASIEALQGLSKELNKNQAVQNAAQANPEVKKLTGNLQGILKQLDQQKQFVKDLITRQAGTTNVQNVPGGIPGGGAPAGGSSSAPPTAPSAGGPSAPPTAPSAGGPSAPPTAP